MHFPTPIDITGYFVVPPINSQPSQPIATEQFNPTQTSITAGGLVIIFVLMIHISLGLCHKRQREKRIAARREQIKTLERIWKIPSHQREI
jgi:hypothetical protein